MRPFGRGSLLEAGRTDKSAMHKTGDSVLKSMEKHIDEIKKLDSEATNKVLDEWSKFSNKMASIKNSIK